jgi:hypothetical protein
MKRKLWRAVVEVAFIMFLFYANLLMGEYERANSTGGKSLIAALVDIFTVTNCVIGLLASLVGYAAVEFLRAKLWDSGSSYDGRQAEKTPRRPGQQRRR